MATLVHDLELPAIDFFADNGRDARLNDFRELRDGGHWLARGLFGFALTRYEDVVAILRDKRWHNASRLIAEMSGIDDQEFLQSRRESILSAEGDTHTRLRRLVGPAFSPRSADRLRPYMREVIAGLVDPLLADGRCELVGDVCEPYPIPIICELLGAPKEDWKLFSVWASDLLRIFNNNLGEDLPYIKRASAELDVYVKDLIAARRHDPNDDLLTDLIAAGDAGDRLNEDELTSLVTAVIVGGTDTTRNQLACTVALFTEHPDQWTLLADNPSLAPRAVEDSMRILGAIRGTGRFASEDIEYRGVLFPKGTVISPSLQSANRDAAIFADADRFDITREPSSHPQLTFGSGIHYCLGAALARAELQEALPLLAQRMANLALDGDIVWKPAATGIWGPDVLPLRFTPQSGATA